MLEVHVPNHGLVEHASDRGHDERAKDCSAAQGEVWGPKSPAMRLTKYRQPRKGTIRPMLGHALRLLGSSRGRSPARTYRPVHSDRCAPRRQLPRSLPLRFAHLQHPLFRVPRPCHVRVRATNCRSIAFPACQLLGPMPRHQHRPLSPPGCLRTRLGILFSSRNIRRRSRL
jgi:hypothetical protein